MESQEVWPDPITVLERPLYTVAEAAYLLRLRPDKVRRWLDGYRRAGKAYDPVIRKVSTGSDEVTWGEFVELGYLREFRDARVSLQTLRPFIILLRERFDIPYPLAHEGTYLADRRTLVLQMQKESGVDESLFMVIDPRQHGEQLVISPAVPPLNAPVEQFLHRVEFEGFVARRWMPFGRGSRVIVDPEQTFGIPTIRGIRTEVLAEAFDAGESVDDLAEGYGLSRDEVEEAIRWELPRSEAA
jgi:uncharacterized protein (DUF433 family)